MRARLTSTGSITGLVTNSGMLTSSGPITGDLANSGTAVLSGRVNGAVSNAGRITLTGLLRASGVFSQTASGVLDLGGRGAALGGLAGAGAVRIGSGILTLTGESATSFAGTLEGSASGFINKNGSGTLTLTGANSFAGLTSVDGGALVIAAGASLAGGIGNAASLTNAGSIGGLVQTFAGATTLNTGTFAGGATNAGMLTSSGTINGDLSTSGTALLAGQVNGAISNAGRITLTGATTGIGAVSQSSFGTVFDLAGNSTVIGSLAGRGTVQLGSATLTTGGNNASTNFEGVIAGSGGLIKAGSGTFTLTGANSFSGATTIAGGALQLGNGGTSGAVGSGGIVNNAALIINRSDAVSLANAIAGSGVLVQDGAGTTRLTGANSYTGGTLVNRGRLVGDIGALQGTIITNAVVEFAMPANGTFAGALGGTGRVEKTGAGILTYRGDGRSLTGPFAVLGGGLRLDGANGGRLDRAVVTLAAGTTLSGTGLIGGLVAEGGALVTPGSSLGLIGVTGDVTLRAASRFLAQVTEAGADLIAAGGTARLAGALDVVNLGGANYRFNTAFTVIEAAGGINGSFDAVTFTGFSPIYRPVLRTSVNGVAVVLAPASLAGLAGTGLTTNQAAVAARFDAAVAAGFDPQAFFGVYSLAPAALAGALDQLSGEVHPAMGRAAMRQSRLPREAVLERAAGAALASNPQGNSWGGWGKLMRSWGDVAAAQGAASQQTDTEGFVIGFDGGTANDARALRFGIYGSYLNTRIAMDARGSSGRIEQAGGGIYTSLALGGFSLVAGGGAARFDILTNRTIALPGLAGGTSTASAGDMAQVFGRMGYRFDLGAASLEPFVAGDAAWIALDQTTERGGAAALAIGRQKYRVAGATTGLALKAPLGRLRLDAEGAARFELGDRAPEALIALAAAPGQTTRITAPRLAGTAFTGRLGAMLPITKRIQVRLDYAGEFSNTDTEHTAQAGLSIAF
ncbi:MAG: autotransporter domain-containing protein [Erythrobacter sp.]